MSNFFPFVATIVWSFVAPSAECYVIHDGYPPPVLGGITLLWLANLGFWWSHASLGDNWFPDVRTRDEQTLSDQGCYAHVRHPMYTALWIWAIGNALIWHGMAVAIQAFFWLDVAVIAVLFNLRAAQEEEMLVGKLGEEYRQYMGRVRCRFVPYVL